MFLKPLLTIIFALFLLQGFGQTDSLLQRLIDSAKNQQQVARPATPVVKDTQKPVIKPSVIKKDSFNSLATVPLDSLAARTRDTFARANIISDTLKKDSSAAIVPVTPLHFLPWQDDTAFARLLNPPVTQLKNISVLKDGDARVPQQKDFLFYLLVGVVLLLALIRQLFPKYFQNMLRLMFQASFRQKQTREQLMQEPLPSLLMNILFVIVGGLFIALLAENYHWLNVSFLKLALYSITILALVYIFKYIVILFTGWAFQVRESASTYGFIVFLVNKVIGLTLLPLLLLFAYSTGSFQEITITIAGTVVAFLFIFRYIISLTVIRSTLNIHPIHFFIYLCAVEIVPMLIIYKILFNYIGNSN